MTSQRQRGDTPMSMENLDDEPWESENGVFRGSYTIAPDGFTHIVFALRAPNDDGSYNEYTFDMGLEDAEQVWGTFMNVIVDAKNANKKRGQT
jgi:hypothetical protein